MDDDAIHPQIRRLREMGEAASKPSVIFETLLASRYPDVPWRRPILVKDGDREGVACRICIAQYGFKAGEGALYGEIGAFVAHLIKHHPID